MLKKLAILAFCSSALLANDLAPETNPCPLEIVEETPKWDHFSFVTIGVFNAGIGQRYSYGYCGIDYSLNVFSMITVSTFWANVNALGYLAPKELKYRPYLGVGGMYGIGYGKLDPSWAWHSELFRGAKAFAGCEFKTNSGKIHFLEIGSLLYPAKPILTGRYGFSF